MSDVNFEAFLQDVYSGHLLVGVDRHFARRFFMEASLEFVKEKTGDAPALQKGTITALLVLGYLSTIGAMIFGFVAFQWWGIIPLIVCPLAMFFYMSASGYGRAGPYVISLFLIGALAFLLVPDVIPFKAKLFGVLFVLGLWSFRLIYVLSTIFFRSFALRSQRHFNYLSPGLEVVTAEARA